MRKHVVVGSGPIGTATAQLLADQGDDVVVVTRSGSGPEHPRIRLVAADAADSERLVEIAQGATAIYNCANPPYHRWTTDWPPLAAALLIGLADVFGQVVFPHIAGMTVYLVMAAVLLWRPRGLFGSA